MISEFLAREHSLATVAAMMEHEAEEGSEAAPEEAAPKQKAAPKRKAAPKQTAAPKQRFAPKHRAAPKKVDPLALGEWADVVVAQPAAEEEISAEEDW